MCPQEINKWSWSKFIFTSPWLLKNKFYELFALSLLFPLSFFISIYIGRNGNALLWEKHNCKSADDLKKHNKHSLITSSVFYIIYGALAAFAFVYHYSISKPPVTAENRVYSYIAQSEAVAEIVGDIYYFGKKLQHTQLESGESELVFTVENEKRELFNVRAQLIEFNGNVYPYSVYLQKQSSNENEEEICILNENNNYQGRMGVKLFSEDLRFSMMDPTFEMITELLDAVKSTEKMAVQVLQNQRVGILIEKIHNTKDGEDLWYLEITYYDGDEPEQYHTVTDNFDDLMSCVKDFYEYNEQFHEYFRYEDGTL